jgi:hypothetical protein
MTTRMRRVDELTIGVAIAASGFKKVTEFGYWLSQFVGLVSSEEHQLVIHDSVAGCIYTNCNINKEHRKEGDAFGTELCLFN